MSRPPTQEEATLLFATSESLLLQHREQNPPQFPDFNPNDSEQELERTVNEALDFKLCAAGFINDPDNPTRESILVLKAETALSNFQRSSDFLLFYRTHHPEGSIWRHLAEATTLLDLVTDYDNHRTDLLFKIAILPATVKEYMKDRMRSMDVHHGIDRLKLTCHERFLTHTGVQDFEFARNVASSLGLLVIGTPVCTAREVADSRKNYRRHGLADQYINRLSLNNFHGIPGFGTELAFAINERNAELGWQVLPMPGLTRPLAFSVSPNGLLMPGWNGSATNQGHNYQLPRFETIGRITGLPIWGPYGCRLSPEAMEKIFTDPEVDYSWDSDSDSEHNPILVEQTMESVMHMVPNQHPCSCIHDTGATTSAVGNGAILKADSLCRLQAGINIRGATGVAQVNIIGIPHNQRDAIAMPTLLIPGLTEHILSVPKATQRNSDGHCSVFHFNAYASYHILLSDPHVQKINAKYLEDMEPYVIGTATLVNNLYREELEPSMRKAAQQEYTENLNSQMSTLNMVSTVPVSTTQSSSHLDAGLSMLANIREAKADSTSA